MNAEGLLQSLLRGGLSRSAPDRLARLGFDDAVLREGGVALLDRLAQAGDRYRPEPAADQRQEPPGETPRAEPTPDLRAGAVPPSAPPVGGGRLPNPPHDTARVPPVAFGAGAPLAPPEAPELPGAADALAPPLPEASPGAAPRLHSASAPAGEEQALTLVRAMIAAAKADGGIAPEERRRILARLAGTGADAAGLAFVEAEMDRPADLDALLRTAPDRQTALRIYAASLLAIDAGAPAATAYLGDLAQRLGLDPVAVETLHERAGLPPPARG